MGLAEDADLALNAIEAVAGRADVDGVVLTAAANLGRAIDGRVLDVERVEAAFAFQPDDGVGARVGDVERVVQRSAAQLDAAGVAAGAQVQRVGVRACVVRIARVDSRAGKRRGECVVCGARGGDIRAQM